MIVSGQVSPSETSLSNAKEASSNPQKSEAVPPAAMKDAKSAYGIGASHSTLIVGGQVNSGAASSLIVKVCAKGRDSFPHSSTPIQLITRVI